MDELEGIFMNKLVIKKYIVFIVGCLVMGCGIRLCDFAQLGVDPMSVLDLGLTKHIPITFGTANLIVSLIMVGSGFILDKKNVTVATVIALFMVSIGIDLFSILPIGYQTGLPAFILMIIGFLIYCLGISITQIPHCGYAAYDCLVFGLMEKTNKEYHFFRWIIDGSYSIIGWLLGGTLGVNTFVVFFCTGKVVEFIVPKLKKVIKF